MHEDGFDGDNEGNNPRPKKKSRSAHQKDPNKPRTANVCKVCKQNGHKTTRSKKCPFNPANPNYAGPPANQDPLPDADPISAAQQLPSAFDIKAELDAFDADEMDQMQLGEDLEDDDNFHECTTWDSNDDGNIIPRGEL